MNRPEMRERLQNKLTKKRFEHSLGLYRTEQKGTSRDRTDTTGGIYGYRCIGGSYTQKHAKLSKQRKLRQHRRNVRNDI